jgi:excisionase family DNA binding protein
MAVYTTTETAKQLRVSELTIRRLIKAGQIKAVMVGKQMRITQCELNRILGITHDASECK